MFVISLLTCNKNYPVMLYVCVNTKQLREKLNSYGVDVHNMKDEDLDFDNYPLTKKQFEEISKDVSRKLLCNCRPELVVSRTKGDLVLVMNDLWEQNV